MAIAFVSTLPSLIASPAPTFTREPSLYGDDVALLNRWQNLTKSPTSSNVLLSGCPLGSAACGGRYVPLTHISSVVPVLNRRVALAQSVAWTDTETGIPFQSYIDPVHSVRYSIAFPASTTSTEFVGEIIAPIANKWVGLSLGGGGLVIRMSSSLSLMLRERC